MRLKTGAEADVDRAGGSGSSGRGGGGSTEGRRQRGAGQRDTAEDLTAGNRGELPLVCLLGMLPILCAPSVCLEHFSLVPGRRLWIHAQQRFRVCIRRRGILLQRTHGSDRGVHTHRQPRQHAHRGAAVTGVEGVVWKGGQGSVCVGGVSVRDVSAGDKVWQLGDMLFRHLHISGHQG